MDKQEYKRTFELHSEKVRNIIGRVPSTLIRYGIIITFAILLIVMMVLDYFPYEKKIQGKAYIYDIPEVTTDTICILVELELHGIKNTKQLLHKSVKLSTFEFNSNGLLIDLVPYKTIKGRNLATLKLPNKKLYLIKQSQVDYSITMYKTSVLRKILKSLGITPGLKSLSNA